MVSQNSFLLLQTGLLPVFEHAGTKSFGQVGMSFLLQPGVYFSLGLNEQTHLQSALSSLHDFFLVPLHNFFLLHFASSVSKVSKFVSQNIPLRSKNVRFLFVHPGPANSFSNPNKLPQTGFLFEEHLGIPIPQMTTLSMQKGIFTGTGDGDGGGLSQPRGRHMQVDPSIAEHGEGQFIFGQRVVP